MQHRSAYGRGLMSHSIIYGAGEVGDVVIGVLHCHQDTSQVTVKWKLLILDLEQYQAN